MKPLIVQNILIYISAAIAICGALILLSLNLENGKKWALMMIFVIGGGVSLFSLIYSIYIKKTLFSNREALSINEIYVRYYSNSGLSQSTVLELWQLVATTLSLPAEKLRPTDNFGYELGPYRVIDDDLDQLQTVTTQRLEKFGIKTDLSAIKTLDDYIRYVGVIIETVQCREEHVLLSEL